MAGHIISMSEGGSHLPGEDPNVTSAKLRALAAVLALAVAFSVGVAGCGDGEDSDNGAATSASGEATGEPINVGNITDIAGLGGTFEPWLTALRAYYKWLNQNGGIDGRPVNLIVEDSAGDAAKNAIAARKLVVQDNVSALVGNANLTDGGSQKYLASQGIPVIGSWCNALADVCEAENVFSIAGPDYNPEYCGPWLGDLAYAEGARKIAYFALDLEISQNGIDCTRALNREQGVEEVAPVSLSSPTQVDYRPAVKKAIDAGAEDIVAIVDAGSFARLIKAGEQLGFKGRYFSTNAQVSTMEGLGPMAKQLKGRVFGNSWTPYAPKSEDNPDVMAFKQSVPEAVFTDGWGFAGWVAGMIATDAIKEVGTDSEDLLEYMNGLRDYTAHDLLGPWSWGASRDEEGEGVRRGPARCVVRIVWEGDAYDVADSSDGGKIICTDPVDSTAGGAS